MKQMRHFVRLLATLLAATIAADVTFDDSKEHALAFSLSDYAMLVQELNIRRRVNVLYPNPQSIFDGLQAGFVNVSTGNLTFKRRDIVARAGGGIVVFARVYDSRAGDNDDLGPGWRLSLAEELRLDDAEVVYIDRAGARHRFSEDADGTYVATPPTPRHAATRIAFDDEGTATLIEADGTVRAFEAAGVDEARLRVVRVETGHRRLDFRYDGDGLREVIHDRDTLFAIERERSTGRIKGVEDAHGRRVVYGYTGDGLLKDVYDIGGNLWWHEYDADGRLVAAMAGNRRPYLLAAYDRDGRAVESETGRRFAFSYAERRTTVVDGTGARHVFERNAAGVTVGLSSTAGADWRLGLNAESRVKVAELAAKTIEYEYDAAGRITMTAETTDDGRDEREYRYDARGRLSAVAGTDPLTLDYAAGKVDLDGAQRFRYELSTDGRVAGVWLGDRRMDADYDDDGLASLSRGADSVRFYRDRIGRLVEIAYPSGNANRYFHDALGNRNRVEFAEGGSVHYGYDAAGNLVTVETNADDGRVRHQTTTIGDMNRVERIVYEGGGTLDIAYDGMGRPSRFDTDEDRVSAEYDDAGRLIELRSRSTGEVWEAPKDAPSPPLRTLAEQRLAALSRDTFGPSQPSYGVLGFADVTFQALPLDPVELGAPGLAAARDLAAAAAPLFRDDGAAAMVAFEKPSNTIFQPAEYRATNCCVSSNHCEDCVPYMVCPLCSNDTMDGVAKSELRGYPREPFERGFTMVCNGGQPIIQDRVNSDPGARDSNDPCAVTLTVRSNAIAYGHSHPFLNHAQANEGIGCLEQKNWDRERVEELNVANRDFSDEDRDAAETRGLPLYLVTPRRNTVRVYREVDGRWDSERI